MLTLALEYNLRNFLQMRCGISLRGVMQNCFAGTLDVPANTSGTVQIYIASVQVTDAAGNSVTQDLGSVTPNK
jgi:hypothetical protein